MKPIRILLRFLLVLSVMMYGTSWTAKAAEPAPASATEDGTTEAAASPDAAGEAALQSAPEESAEPAALYNVWVGGTQVTSDNAGDVLGDGTAAYDADSKTLDLNNPSINGAYESARIYSNGDLTITGKAAVTADDYCIFVEDGSLTIHADLTLSSKQSAILVNTQNGTKANLTILGGTINAVSKNTDGINAPNGLVTISGGEITAIGGMDGILGEQVLITDGVVVAEATDDNRFGIRGDEDSENSEAIKITGGEVTTISENGHGLYAVKGTISIDDALVIETPEGGKLSADATTVCEADGSTAAANVVIVPRTEWTVSFDANGGSGKMDAVKVPVNSSYTLPACGFTAPAAKVFDQWDAGPAGSAITVDSDKILKATWKDLYTVTFNTNGGTAVAAQKVAKGEKAVKPSDPTKKGYAFGGWYKDASFAAAFDFGTPITANVTVYAKWTENAPAPVTYTVSFDANGGTGSMANMTVKAGEKLTLPSNGFTAPANKEFDKWDAGKPGDTISVTGNKTVKAVWKEKTAPAPTVFTVKFVTNGGSAISDQNVESGKKAVKPADPTKEGSTFDGWYQDEALTKAYSFDAPVTADISVYAKWTENEPAGMTYTVTRGANLSWTKGSINLITITIKRSEDDPSCFKHFKSVAIDGKELTKDKDYTAVSGSTVVTIKNAALQKLESGTHMITVTFDDGKAETKLLVRNKDGTISGGSRSGSRTSGTTSKSGGKTTGKSTKAAKTVDTNLAWAWFLTMLFAAVLAAIAQRLRKQGIL